MPKPVKPEPEPQRTSGEDDHGEEPAGSSADQQPRSAYTMDMAALKDILTSMAETNRQQTQLMMEHQRQETAEIIEKLLKRG